MGERKSDGEGGGGRAMAGGAETIKGSEQAGEWRGGDGGRRGEEEVEKKFGPSFIGPAWAASL